MIKNLEHSCDQVLSKWSLWKKKHNNDEAVFINWSLITLFLNKTNKYENTGYHGMFISCKSLLTSKQQGFIFLLFGSWSLVRSSYPEVFCKKGVPRNFTKFTGKHLCQSLFFNKVADLRPKTCIFIKNRL